MSHPTLFNHAVVVPYDPTFSWTEVRSMAEEDINNYFHEKLKKLKLRLLIYGITIDETDAKTYLIISVKYSIGRI